MTSRKPDAPSGEPIGIYIAEGRAALAALPASEQKED